MSQMKNRLQALSLLDRAFTCITDDELETLVASLPEDHVQALDELCDAPDGGFSDAAARSLALRAHAARGRLSGGLEQVATVLTDPCLAKCIEALGENSDNPTEAQLLEVTPALIEEFGVADVRLMLAASIAGEAAASVMLTHVLKHDDTLKLPPAEPIETGRGPQEPRTTAARRQASLIDSLRSGPITSAAVRRPARGATATPSCRALRRTR
jgi:hypothetical protein